MIWRYAVDISVSDLRNIYDEPLFYVTITREPAAEPSKHITRGPNKGQRHYQTSPTVLASRLCSLRHIWPRIEAALPSAAEHKENIHG